MRGEHLSPEETLKLARVRPRHVHSPDVDARSLASRLRRRISGEVRFDKGSRALYATDGSNYRQVPIGVVIPRSSEDVVETIALCREYGAPILPRGGGTSLGGQCCNVAVVMDMSKYMHRIIDIDPDDRSARFQPGVVLDHLRNAAEEYNLTFAPDPATHSHNTLGGMIGNNSCGIHSVMGGKTDDNIHELEILTYDGLRMRVGETSEAELEQILREGGRKADIYSRLRELRDRYADSIRKRYPQIPRQVSGYNLNHLLPENGFHIARALVGSEGTCVTVLEAKGRLVHSPPIRSLIVLGYPDIYTAAADVMEILEYKPVGLEGIDDRLVKDMKLKGVHSQNLSLLPEGESWLLVELGSDTEEEAEEKVRRFTEDFKQKKNAPFVKYYEDEDEEEEVWIIRESGLAATARVPGSRDAWPGWEDSAVHPENLADYLRDLRGLLEKHGYGCSLYGHFGQGCVHTRIDFDLITREGIDKYRAFVNEASDMVVRYNGSFSGEHGDGQARGELLPRMFGAELMDAFREFKTIWDPHWKMNPGKVINPYRNDENLRLGTSYNPPSPKTRFTFSGDKGSFPCASLRCVGVGNCRGDLKGTMCPSYMVTHEERHSTRGRAHMLFEMFQNDVLTGGWNEKAVRESLEYCLSCKSCKGECPMHVDMARYKAEFYYHYYKWRPRPVDAYTMGLIYWWSRLASRMPKVANFVLQKPVISSLVKFMGGISTKRDFPAYAEQTFKEWFQQREPVNPDGQMVVLWADTFNNHFYPEIGKAAVKVLEGAGYRVHVPPESLCCGRPLFDYGMLGLARRLLQRVINVLRPYIRAGVPVIGLEPACLSTFQDELVDLFPHDQDAQRLSKQSYLLGKFLEEKADDYSPPKLNRKAVVHGHCTHKAVLKMEGETKLLKDLGLDFNVLDSGCCGVSGAFGFRRKNYDMSLDIGGRVLIPAVKKAEKDTLVIADGFSCREQIAHTTDREALHLAQVILIAMQEGEDGPGGEYPERKYMERPRHGR